MTDCCDKKGEDLAATAQKHKGVLWTVLIINLVMFFIEAIFGLLSHSLALVGDSLDMLGDAAVYGSSLLVVGLGHAEKARVARLKAWIMLTFGLVVSAKCIYRAIYPQMPDLQWMLAIGTLALVANLICLKLLSRFRHDDVNMSSVWICSRNDIIANTSVLISAGLVYVTHSPLPDIMVGFGLAVLFIRSALQILRWSKEPKG